MPDTDPSKNVPLASSFNPVITKLVEVSLSIEGYALPSALDLHTTGVPRVIEVPDTVPAIAVP